VAWPTIGLCIVPGYALVVLVSFGWAVSGMSRFIALSLARLLGGWDVVRRDSFLRCFMIVSRRRGFSAAELGP